MAASTAAMSAYFLVEQKGVKLGAIAVMIRFKGSDMPGIANATLDYCPHGVWTDADPNIPLSDWKFVLNDERPD